MNKTQEIAVSRVLTGKTDNYEESNEVLPSTVNSSKPEGSSNSSFLETDNYEESTKFCRPLSTHPTQKGHQFYHFLESSIIIAPSMCFLVSF